MSCSRAFAVEPLGVLVGNRHRELLEQLARRSGIPARRARTPETPPAAPAGTARCRPPPSRSCSACDRCWPHLPRDRSGWQVGLAGGGGVAEHAVAQKEAAHAGGRRRLTDGNVSARRLADGDSSIGGSGAADEARVPAIEVGAMRGVSG